MHGPFLSISEINRRLDGRELLSVKEAASVFGVHINSVYGWIQNGKLAVLKRPGGRSFVGIPVSAIREALGIE